MLHSKYKQGAILILIGLLLTSHLVIASTVDMTILGNVSRSTEEIRRAAELVNCANFDSVCVDVICKRILEHYLGLGFLDAVVRCESVGDSSLMISIDEGSQSFLGFVSLEGVSITDSDLLHTFFEKCYGKPVDTSCLENCIEKVLRFYDGRGYPLAKMSPVGFVRDGNRIGLRFEIEEGPKARVKKITFGGLKNTRAKALIRKIGFVQGRDYDGRKVDSWQKKLLMTGIFRTVSPAEISLDMSDTTVTVNFDVNETRTTRIEGMGAYAPLGKTKTFVGSLNFSMQNIAGTLRQCSILWTRPAPGRLRWNIGYKEPTFFSSDISADLSFGSDVQDTSYAYRRFQAIVLWQTESQVEAGIGITLASTRDRTSDYSEGDFSEKGMVFSLKLSADNPILDRHGKLYGTLGTALSRISYSDGKPDKTISEAYLSVKYAKRMVSLFVFSTEFCYRYVNSSQGNVPSAKKVRIGGAGSIRGYAEESFSVDQYIRLSIEPGFLLNDLSRLYGFLDFAMLDGSGYSLGDLKSQPFGYGIGLVAGSDAGAVRIDIGVRRGGGWDDARLHFSVLGSF
ncbi:MAG: POTRA domain-containing protein [bacterium]